MSDNNQDEPVQKQNGPRRFKRGDLPPARDPERNPCIEEGEISMQCLVTNNYRQEQCKDEFENYTKCRKFWRYVQLKRLHAGIQPNLPSVTERDTAIKEHLSDFKKTL